tara:strand:- start:54 stop:1112 length:1059 start_codon:yes stop_codon:yes gene_type:complete
MKRKTIWLFNFSSSWNAGGFERTKETVKWFDNNSGAYFIINNRIKNEISKYNKKNKYFFVSQNKIKRLLVDGYYMPKIIDEIGRPDVYFSYGIPVFNDIAEINWFHISNALTLKTKNISLPLIKRIQMWILKNRIIRSMKHVNIATGESEFSVKLLKDEINDKKIKCYYNVLPNGYDMSIIENVLNKKRKTSYKYGITIGTYAYKKLEVALELFHEIKKLKKLKKFIIVGSYNDIPKSVIDDRFIEIKSNISRKELFDLLYNAEYYISASQIENSSIAVLEALLLSKNIVLSNIPSHNEMLRNLKTKKVILENYNMDFIVLENKNKKFIPISWIDVCEKLSYIIDDFKGFKN